MTQELQFFTQDRNEFETLINHLLHLGLYTTDPGFWERASDDQVYMVSVYTGNFRGEFAVYAPRMDFDSGNVASLEDILAFNTKEKLWHFIRTLPDTTPDTSAIEPEDEPEDRDATMREEEKLLTRVVVFGNSTAAYYARKGYLEAHPNAQCYDNSTVKDNGWLIKYTASRHFEGERFNEVVIDGSLLLSVNQTGITRITNELRYAMESARRV